MSVHLKNLLNRSNYPVELDAFGGEMFTSGRCQRVVAGAAIVFGGSPPGTDPAVEKESLESGIERAFADLKNLFGDVPQALCDAIAVHRPQREDAQKEEVEGPGEELRC
jgi:hypothetical protein